MTLRKTATIMVYVGLDLVGDGLMKLPFLRALRNAFPQAHITWLAGKGASVYGGMLSPLVAGLLDEVIENADIGSRWPELLRRPLADRDFDLIIDTQNRLLTTLILKRIRHRRFISSTGNYLLSDIKPRNRRKGAALTAQLLDLVELASGQPAACDAHLAIPADLEAAAQVLLPAAFEAGGPRYVGLAPGAGGRHKCWPLDRYLDLGHRLSEAGYVPVVLLGPGERDWEAQVRAALPQALLPVQDSGNPSPLLTIALARRLSAAVANDAGTGHMVAAAATPLVSLFGPTSPDKFAPAAPILTVLTAQSFGGTRAMEAIPVDAVFAAVTELAAKSAPSASETPARLRAVNG